MHLLFELYFLVVCVILNFLKSIIIKGDVYYKGGMLSSSFLTREFYFRYSLYLYRYHLIYNNCSCATHFGHHISFEHFPFDNVSVSGVLFRWRGAIFLLYFLPYVNYRSIKYDWIYRARLHALCLHRTRLWSFCRDWVRFCRDLLHWNRTVMLYREN